MADVDAALWVVDAAKLTSADRAVLALVPVTVPVVAAVNKIDAVRDKSTLLPRLADIAPLRDFAAIVPVSAEQGLQIDALKDELAKLLPESPPLYGDDALTDRDERFLAAEFVREKIFRMAGEEIPYAATVAIDRFEHEGQLRRIFVSVLVDKPGQRAILLGEAGQRMKAISTQARR